MHGAEGERHRDREGERDRGKVRFTVHGAQCGKKKFVQGGRKVKVHGARCSKKKFVQGGRKVKVHGARCRRRETQRQRWR